jgi:outer membrane protein OmpA-like peptidoglycan-associated protein
VVIDSGLATTGPVSFTREKMIYALASDVGDYLQNIHALVELDESVAVDWFGLGDVAAPQMALTNYQRGNLKDIWTEIITRGNGNVVFHDDPPSTLTIEGLPAVSAIDLEPEPLPELMPVDEPIFLDDAALHFLPDLAEYIDTEEVRKTLRPYAILLAQQSDLRVHLIGTTASYGSTGPEAEARSYQLSQARADKVRDTLVELGAPEEHITTEGQGYFDIWHRDEYDSNGIYLPHIAAQNRKVVILATRT